MQRFREVNQLIAESQSKLQTAISKLDSFTSRNPTKEEIIVMRRTKRRLEAVLEITDGFLDIYCDVLDSDL